MKKLPRMSKAELTDASCDFCGKQPPQIVDAPTFDGPWAYMCHTCFSAHGIEGQGTLHVNRRTNLGSQL